MIEEKHNCRLCGGLLQTVLDFGESALANSFLKDPKADEFKAPLVVAKCADCHSVQLKHTVDSKALFSNYLYSSSDSPSLRKHFEDYAASLIEGYNLKPGDLVADIGSNDGVLLKPLKERGIDVLGIEPATNLAELANKNGLPTINDFFDRNTFSKIGRKAKAITCNNCFAHIDNLKEILLGVENLLEDDGVFVFENAYLLDTINGKYFDQIYHEHIFYHSISPLYNFLTSNGFNIVDIERNKNQGGSIRVFCKKSKSPCRILTPKVVDLYAIENEAGLHRASRYEIFRLELEHLKSELNKLINYKLSLGQTFACYGAPAKATLFCKFFELNPSIIKFIVDDSKFKQGLYLPDTHIPIVPREKLYESNIDNVIITAWNFADSIIRSNLDYSGNWIIPMPEIRETKGIYAHTAV